MKIRRLAVWNRLAPKYKKDPESFCNYLAYLHISTNFKTCILKFHQV